MNYLQGRWIVTESTGAAQEALGIGTAIEISDEGGTYSAKSGANLPWQVDFSGQERVLCAHAGDLGLVAVGGVKQDGRRFLRGLAYGTSSSPEGDDPGNSGQWQAEEEGG